MEVIIGLILLLCILFGVGYILRRNIYKDVDRLEAWKIEIMNRSIIDELSKVKELKMIGQAEELFEQWRSEWDEIITTQLPEVEELLYEAEELADKYRFKKSKEVLQHIENVLITVDENIDKIIEEINELVTSEEKNKVESEEVKELYKKLRKTLLAHSHQFGKAYDKLDQILSGISDSLKEFDSETNEGNYLSARKILVGLKSELNALQIKVNEIPKLLTDCNITKPNLLSELEDGYKEMVGNGYFLEHIQVDQEIERMKKQLEGFRKQIEETEIEEVAEALQGMQIAIDSIYDLLEKEVEASQFVKQKKSTIDEKLTKLTEQKMATLEETELVKQSYRLSENEVDKQKLIEKQISQIEKKFAHIKQSLDSDHVAHSIMKEELEEIEKQINKLFEEHNEYREMLQTLRKDELEARERLNHLKQILLETIRNVQQSNIPGLPEDFVKLIDKAKREVQKVTEKLEEIPLNMTTVNKLLEETVQTVEEFKNTAEELIEQVFLVEQVIQYGNRYRSRNRQLSSSFSEAEMLFRNSEYGKSLEMAASALEQVEPGALKKIKILINDQT
ncbi:septation ring formation regulator EzrA [Metabacillus niabensis]|uniref:Septation ring formation regulator EzrA n=1 Tax=Metabacillus niabensis TaxID=324854 RepID=A0ABT9YZW4_9BACI|nr:septation ring formation regulator EzrA [Metabacillus niabensis]MDQ0224585.1 septation ring formation regulator [Metabacillus niabensis]